MVSSKINNIDYLAMNYNSVAPSTTSSLMPYVYVVLIFLLILLFATHLRSLPKFFSRKLVHIGMGVLLTSFDRNLSFEFVLGLEMVTLAFMVWKPTLFSAFSRGRFDDGIWTYCGCVASAKLLGVPLAALSPFFYADPMACIVGTFSKRYFPNFFLSFRLVKEKTIAGSSAFFLCSVLSLLICGGYPFVFSTVLSGLLTLIELIFVHTDNLPVGITLLTVALIGLRHAATALIVSVMIDAMLWMELCCYNCYLCSQMCNFAKSSMVFVNGLVLRCLT